MEKKDIVLDADCYEKIYECWNGKSESCITTRNIPEEKKNCALKKILDNINMKNLIDVLESDQKEKETTAQEKHKERKKFVDYLGDTYGYHLPLLQDIDKQEDSDFYAAAAESIFIAIKKDRALLNRIFFPESFNEWDRVEMNEKANWKYSYSRKWSTWIVVRKNSYDFNVCFDKITANGYSGKKNPIRDIEAEYMINISKKTSRNMTLNDIQKRVSKIVKMFKEEKEGKVRNNEKKGELTTKFLLKENFLLPGDGEWNYVLNYREMTKFIAPKLYTAYGNKELYSPEDMNAPPSECHPNVLKLEFSNGCDYNRCTYCNLYKDIKYKSRTFEQFKDHMDKVMAALEDDILKIERVFIGGGNALAGDKESLIKSLSYIENKLEPRRISMYARTQDINHKWLEWLRQLNNAWLTHLYRWAETGSDNILKYIKKWTTLDDMLKASEMLGKTDIDLSVTLMPGIWGKRFDEENIQWTIKFLNATNAKFITFMCINSSPNSEYDKTMKEETLANTNRPLTNVEVVKQIKKILEELEPREQKIGMFGPEVHEIDYNPFYFKVTFNGDGKREAINLCEKYIDTHFM